MHKLVVTQEQYEELNYLREQYNGDAFQIGRFLNYNIHSEKSRNFECLKSMDIVDVHTAAVTGLYTLPETVEDVFQRRINKLTDSGAPHEVTEEIYTLRKELKDLKMI